MGLLKRRKYVFVSHKKTITVQYVRNVIFGIHYEDRERQKRGNNPTVIFFPRLPGGTSFSMTLHNFLGLFTQPSDGILNLFFVYQRFNCFPNRLHNLKENRFFQSVHIGFYHVFVYVSVHLPHADKCTFWPMVNIDQIAIRITIIQATKCFCFSNSDLITSPCISVQ